MEKSEINSPFKIQIKMKTQVITHVILFLSSSTTLEGADTGILFFLTPQWDKLLEINVSY